MGRSKKEIPAVFCMLAVLAAFAVLIGMKKEWFHVDEIYSYHFVSQVEYPSVNGERPDMAYRNAWHDPAYFEDYFTVSSEEAFDISGVYQAIIQDAHPPLYYILLHLTCSAFFRNTFTFWSGLLLNLVFLVLTLWLLYLLAKKLLRSTAASLAVMALYGFSAGTMDTFTLIRMYMVMTFFSVLLVYTNVSLRETAESGEDSKKAFLKYYILLFVSMVLGMLTQYYFIVFAFFIGACFWILLLSEKNFRHAAVYAGVSAAALFCTYGIWPDMIPDMIGGSSAGQVVQNMQTHSDHIGRIRGYIALVNEDLFGGQLKWFLLLLATAFAAVFVKRRSSASMKKTAEEAGDEIPEPEDRKEENRLFGPEFRSILGITLSCSIYLVFSALTAPFKVDRYVFILFPFIILAVIFLLKNLLKEFQCQKILTAAFSAVLILMLIMGYIDPGLRYLYHKRAEKMTVLSEYKDAPTILVHNGYSTRKKSAELSAYWRNMENSIYITISANLSELEGNIPDSERLILYLDKDLKDPKDVMKKIKRMSGKKNSTGLGKTAYSKVYVLE